MTTPIEFYFDLSSPYGYLASARIDALGARHGRRVNWHPLLLGAVFKVSGAAPLTTIPLKGEYALRDMARSARLLAVPFRMPSRFPVPTQHAARLVLWAGRTDEAAARSLAAALYRAYFADDRDISDPEICGDVAAQTGHARAAAMAGMDDPGIKAALRLEVEQAMAAGVFGSPFFIVDGEPFWGADRLDQLERWLTTGGW